MFHILSFEGEDLNNLEDVSMFLFRLFPGQAAIFTFVIF